MKIYNGRKSEPLFLMQLKKTFLNKRSIFLPEAYRYQRYYKKDNDPILWFSKKNKTFFRARLNLDNYMHGKGEMFEKKMHMEKSLSQKKIFSTLEQILIWIGAKFCNPNFFSKNNIKNKTIYFFDSYYLFSYGHMALLWNFVDQISKAGRKCILVYQKNLVAEPEFLSLLKKCFPETIYTSEISRPFDLSSFIFPFFLIKKKKIKPKNDDSLKSLENRFISSRSILFNLGEHDLILKNFGKLLPSFKFRNFIIFHLRKNSFREWNSPRSGLELHQYDQFFKFLCSIKILPIVLCPSDQYESQFFINIFKRGIVKEGMQPSLIKNAFMVIGSRSGPTTLGPAFSVPTLNFDCPTPLGVISPVLQVLLLKKIYNSEKKCYDLALKKNYDTKNILCDEDVSFYGKNSKGLCNSNEDLKLGFLEMIFKMQLFCLRQKKAKKILFYDRIEEILNLKKIALQKKNLLNLKTAHQYYFCKNKITQIQVDFNTFVADSSMIAWSNFRKI